MSLSLVQQQLEAKVIAEISAALVGIDGVTISGSWQPSATGFVRWISAEDGISPCFVSVSVGAPAKEAHSSAYVSFAGRISLYTRMALDPTGSTMLAVAAAIQDTVFGWQSEAYNSEWTRFDLQNLSIDELSISPGDPPVVDGRDAVASWPISFRGSLL